MGDTPELSGKVALVAGGGRGIGLAIAEALASAGARVLLTDIDEAEGARVADSLRGRGQEAAFVRADSADEADCARTVEAAIVKFGRLDIFVANAGVHSTVATRDMTLEQFRVLCRVNLKGPFLGLKHAVPAIRRHGEGGSVILISSVASEIGLAGHAHYCASKGGVKLLAKAAALELGPENIRVNSIHPGAIRTRMTSFADQDALAAGVPLKRIGAPDEIGKVAIFLASPRARFITGAEIVVDGGMIVQ